MCVSGTAFAGSLDNIVTYLKMETITTDGTVLDYSGRHHAVVSGNPTLVPGRVGMALQFDGVDDYLRLPALLLDDHDKLTVEYWLKISGYTVNSVCGFGSPDRLYNIRLGTISGDILFAIAGARLTWSSGFSDLTFGQWHHLVLTIDAGDGATVYLDGVAKYQIPIEKVASTLPDIPWFGVGASIEYSESNPTRYVHGAIDEFAIFNRVLSPEEIQTQYNNGLQGIGYEGTLAPVYTSTGFDAPMNNGAVRVKKNRVLPLKTALRNSLGQYITSEQIPNAFPVIQVLYYGGGSGGAVDVTDQALAPGLGMEGNQFVYTTEGKWQFNLKTSNFTGKGTYTVTIVSGDVTKYSIDQSYTPAVFVIE